MRSSDSPEIFPDHGLTEKAAQEGDREQQKSKQSLSSAFNVIVLNTVMLTVKRKLESEKIIDETEFQKTIFQKFNEFNRQLMKYVELRVYFP